MRAHWTSIHVLRALAAIAVVAHHVPLYLAGRVTFPLRTFEHGAAGVDLFFIISGFVMHSATSDRQVAWYEFLAKRWIRVLPMYWLVTLAVTAAVWLMPSAFASFRVSGLDLGKSLFFIPVFTRDGLIRPVVAVGWTLYFEMSFYALVAAWLPVGGRTASLWAAATTVVLAALVELLHLSGPQSGFQLLSPIIVEFAMGVLLSHVVQTRDPSGVSPRARWPIAFGLVLLGVRAISHYSDNALVLARVACWGLGSWMIVAAFLSVEPELSRAARPRKLFDPLGSASYALYLVHGLAFSVFWKLTPSVYKTAPFVAWSVLLAGPLAASLILHVVIEVPLTRWLSARFARWATELRRPDAAASALGGEGNQPLSPF